MKRKMSLMTGLNLHLFRHEGLSYIASIDISLNHIYIRWFDILRSFCPLVALPFVYPLHYCLFTFCATVCLPFALPSVYRLHYRLFTFCTTVLLFVYVVYYRATFCLRFVLPCEELPQCLVSVELPSVRIRVVLPFVDVPPVGQMSARARLSGFP